jgi:predicted ester cyclase
MSPGEMKVHARRIAEELLTQGDLAVANELFADGCRHHAPEPVGSRVDGLKAWVMALRRAFPDLRAIVEDEIAEGDKVVLRLTLGGTHEGPFSGSLPTGRRVAWQLVAILRAGADDRFVELWSSWDRLAVLRQVGAMPDTTEGGG